jgi:hypothetical protein
MNADGIDGSFQISPASSPSYPPWTTQALLFHTQLVRIESVAFTPFSFPVYSCQLRLLVIRGQCWPSVSKRDSLDKRAMHLPLNGLICCPKTVVAVCKNLPFLSPSKLKIKDHLVRNLFVSDRSSTPVGIRKCREVLHSISCSE